MHPGADLLRHLAVTELDLEQVRARLAERGLLRDEAAKIDDTAVDGGAPAPAPAVRTPPTPAPPRAPQRPRVRPADERDELGSVTIGCPACAHRQQAPVEDSRFRCDDCRIRWVWAICRSCRLLAVVDDDIPSWSCPGCQQSNRSWWHADPGNEEIKVTAERRLLADQREQQRVREGIRRRARKTAGWLATLVVLTLAAVLVVQVSGPPSGQEAAGPVCHRFRALQSEISNGSLTLPEMQMQIGDLSERSEGATAEVQSAAALLADAGERPGGVEFKRALTEFGDACAAAGF